MSRTVARPCNAEDVVYIVCSCPDEYDPQSHWEDMLGAIRCVLRKHTPSLLDRDTLEGRELTTVQGNRWVKIVVAEYCGLVSVSVVKNYAGRNGLGDRFLRQFLKRFTPSLRECFGEDALMCIGTASNGEAFYRPLPA